MDSSPPIPQYLIDLRSHFNQFRDSSQKNWLPPLKDTVHHLEGIIGAPTNYVIQQTPEKIKISKHILSIRSIMFSKLYSSVFLLPTLPTSFGSVLYKHPNVSLTQRKSKLQVGIVIVHPDEIQKLAQLYFDKIQALNKEKSFLSSSLAALRLQEKYLKILLASKQQRQKNLISQLENLDSFDLTRPLSVDMKKVIQETISKSLLGGSNPLNHASNDSLDSFVQYLNPDTLFFPKNNHQQLNLVKSLNSILAKQNTVENEYLNKIGLLIPEDDQTSETI